MHVPRNDARAGFLLSLATALLWGLLPFALKGLLPILDAVTITWFRFTGAALVLGLWLALRGGLPGPSQFSGRNAVLMAVTALSLNANYVTYLLGLDHVTPATAQVVIQLAPLALLLGALLLHGERLSRQQILGVSILLAGLVLFFDRRLLELVAGLGDYSLGVAWVLLAALLWASYALAQKELLTRFGSAPTTWIVYLSGALLFLPWARPAGILELDPLGFALLGFATLNTLLSYACFSESLERWEASRSSAVLALTPVTTALAAEICALLLPGLVPPESWTPVSLLGGLLVVTGSATAALGKTSGRGHGQREEERGRASPLQGEP